MSRENFNNQCQIIDLFGTEGAPNRGQMEATQPIQQVANGAGKAMPNHISEDLWTGTRKRHCDSREHVRSLLDRHLRPHN